MSLARKRCIAPWLIGLRKTFDISPKSGTMQSITTGVCEAMLPLFVVRFQTCCCQRRGP